MDDLKLEIRGQIARYLGGEIDVRALYDWLVDATWEVEHRASAEVADFARSAQLTLDEFRAEGWDETELRSRLRGLAGIVLGHRAPVEAISGSTSTTSIESVPFTIMRPSVTPVASIRGGRRPEGAFA